MIPIIIKLIIGAVAVLLVIASLISYFKKKMDEKTTIGWCAFGILITIAASIPGVIENNTFADNKFAGSIDSDYRSNYIIHFQAVRTLVNSKQKKSGTCNAGIFA